MCGIAGIFDPRHELGPHLRLQMAVRMVEGLRHRGPDDSGRWSNADCAFGHCRLSIIDPSSAGRQPIVSDDGRYALVFNGEIYNYVELREELSRESVPVCGNTDAHVLFAGLINSGPSFL